MYIFLNFSGTDTATGRMGLYLYQYDYINIATGRMYWDNHWAYEFNSFRDLNTTGRIQKTVTGRMGSLFQGLY